MILLRAMISGPSVMTLPRLLTSDETNRLRRRLTNDGRKNRMMKAIAIKMMPIVIQFELEEKRRNMIELPENENLRK